MNVREQKENKTVNEIIAVILQKVELIMEKYGYWKVTGSILFGVFLWQFSNIVNAMAKLIEVVK
ncbi:hypothetical protein [Acinetobacter proteolyticus]|uniref:Uncharacterized protein n=1 Tax=Acinetobacter proteolyticus TaxID=1776741 RepID=A0A2N0WBP7_9GAMM|nr:hypothetical protein [Acinetobacter proteolyticus]PKF31926.1 hypothetical protein CW311_16965 [Acinetobacter proteolyticus]